jgi:hypothetical protein
LNTYPHLDPFESFMENKFSKYFDHLDEGIYQKRVIKYSSLIYFSQGFIFINCLWHTFEANNIGNLPITYSFISLFLGMFIASCYA